MISIGKIKVRAIALGFLVDIVGSLLLGLILAIIWVISKTNQGIPSRELHNYPFNQDPFFLTVSFIIGFGLTCLGGYVAGRISKESQVLHGGVVGGLGLIWEVIFYSQVPILYNLTGFLGTVPVGMLGGYLAKIKHTN
jgi:hypothetical protein